MLATLHEIDTAILTEIGEDPTDSDTRAEWAPLLLLSHNATYADICARKLHPKAFDTVTLDENKRFKAKKDADDDNALDHACNGSPIAVLRHGHYTEDAGWGRSDMHGFHEVGPKLYSVPGAEAGGEVVVYYEYVPEPFTKNTYTSDTDNTDVPELVEEQHRMAFVYNGAAAIMRTKKQFNSMAAYQNMAEDEIAKIREEGVRPAVRNVLFRSRWKTIPEIRIG